MVGVLSLEPKVMAPETTTDRRQFTRALLVTNAALLIPALWLAFGDWRSHLTLFPLTPQGNLYDLQARAMLAGRLNVPTNSLGIEGFLHDGKTSTYFGIFPSILRMPVLVFTHHFDGRLTAVSIFLAWLVTCAAIGAMVVQLRTILRRDLRASRLERIATCALAAAMSLGTIFPSLLATPRVYEEDIAWSIALGILFFVGVLSFLVRPGRARFAVVSLITLAAATNRGSTGDAWILAIFALAVFFRCSRHGATWRRSANWFFALGAFSAIVVLALSYAKFGTLTGFDERYQVWTSVYPHRKAFLDANGGTPFGLQFLPTTLLAYFAPFAASLKGLFPYVHLPSHPVQAVGHVTFDQIWPTASLTATTPLLVILSVVGTVVVLAKPSTTMERVLRILVGASIVATGPVLIFGYICPRYLGDFVPWLVLAGGIGFFFLLERAQRFRSWFFGVVIVCSLLAVVMNLALAAGMQPSWTSTQAENFTRAQLQLSPGALAHEISRSASLPIDAPPGHIVIVGACQGVYRTLGPQADIPLSNLEHNSWFALAPTVGAEATLSLHITRTPTRADAEVALMTRGRMRLVLRPIRTGVVRLVVEHPVAQLPDVRHRSHAIVAVAGTTGTIEVSIDPYLERTSIAGFNNVLPTSFAGPGVTTYPAVTSSWVTVATNRPMTTSPLCRELLDTLG